MPEEYPRAPVVAVGAVVVRDQRAVIVRRRYEPFRGQWSIPGGRLELGESLEDAVRRELREETGLEVQLGPVLEVFEWIERAADGVRHHFVIIDYLCTSSDDSLDPGDDAVEAAWVGDEGLAGYDMSAAAAAVIRKGLRLAHPRGDDDTLFR